MTKPGEKIRIHKDSRTFISEDVKSILDGIQKMLNIYDTLLEAMIPAMNIVTVDIDKLDLDAIKKSKPGRAMDCK